MIRLPASDRREETDSSEEDVEEMEAGGTKDGPQQSLLRYRVRLNHRRKPNDRALIAPPPIHVPRESIA